MSFWIWFLIWMWENVMPWCVLALMIHAYITYRKAKKESDKKDLAENTRPI